LLINEKNLNPNSSYAEQDLKSLRARLETIDLCITQLNDRYREVIELVFFEKLKYRELAKLRYLTLNGAEKLVERSVQALNRELKRVNIA
jgi:DNA-directed RNA polymerase specialized sigma24 family protein